MKKMKYSTYDQSWEIARLGGHVLRKLHSGPWCKRCHIALRGLWAFNFNCPGDRRKTKHTDQQIKQDPHKRKLTRASVDAVCGNLDQILVYGKLYTEERTVLMRALNSIEVAFGAVNTEGET